MQAHLRFWLLCVFVLSGFAGLIYQSVWSHYLGLLLGHAAYAQALVLAIFMGGMAAGAAWIARAGQRWRNLIRSYAIIEAVIGVLGLLFHSVFTGVLALGYDWLFPALGAPWAVNLARWLLAAVLILPQTILLGMTFPLMSAGLIRRFPGSDGAALGGLYFSNSIGAAAGALVAAFALLPWIGLPGAIATAGKLNLVVAGLAWLLARDPEPAAQITTVTSSSPAHAEVTLRNSRVLQIVLFGTALSGAASFAYEIIWIRMLSMAVGSTLHAFELMLASFVAGIAFGGLWVRHRADHSAAPLRLVGWMQVGMGMAALVSLLVYANAFAWVGWLMQALNKTNSGYALYNLGTASIAIAIMLPAAFFAGTTLPLFTVTLLRNGHGERAIGRVYAWNTVGAIVGVFASIHLLIPLLGLKLALCAAALVDMGIGLFLLRHTAVSKPDRRGLAIAGGLAALALFVGIRAHYDPLLLASGVFRHGNANNLKGAEIVFYRDGKTASVSTFRSGNNLTIATNGKPDAGVDMAGGRGTDEATMVLLAALPLAFSDTPDNVAVIGFGSGMSTHNLLADTRVQRVDTIEIEPAMVEGARFFGERVERAYNDPRSHIIIDDAKAYFAGQQRKYDVIVSEPSNPWISGVGTLFSKEFYQFVPRHLTEDGLFVQWLQLYEIDEALVGSILQALTPEFDDYVAYLTNFADLVIVAKPKGQLPPIDLDRLHQAQPLLAELNALGMPTADHVAWRKVADAQMLRAMATAWGRYKPNSDYLLQLGLHAPRTRFQSANATTLMEMPYQNGRLLEALDTRHPPALSLDMPSLSYSKMHEFVVAARDSAQVLRNNEISESPAEYEVIPKALNGPDCSLQRSISTGSQWARHTKELFERTVPYLAADDLEGVWIQPTWQHCEQLEPGYAALLALLESHAQRDWDNMDTLGTLWLDQRSEDSGIEHLYHYFDQIALSGILLAQVKQRRWDEIEATLERWSVVSELQYRQQFDIIWALAKNHQPSSAQ